MSKSVIALGVAAGVAFSAPLAAQTWSGASDDPEQLRYRLDLLDAELADLRARLGGQAPAPGGGVSLATGDLELQIAALTRQVEQLQFENRQLRQQLQRQLEDLTFRVTELEGGDVSDVSVDLGTPQPSATPVIASEQADLDLAKRDIQQGRYDQGEDRLRRFLGAHQGSSLTGEAYYWLGQSQFVRGAMGEAANSYLAGYRANQGGAFAADNLLQLGVTLGRLQQVEAGCQTLRQVGRQYPNASATVLDGAAAELANLGCG
ncbi:MAG: tetratricopeptide repeat protein [Pseudomonadota bacterium]